MNVEEAGFLISEVEPEEAAYAAMSTEGRISPKAEGEGEGEREGEGEGEREAPLRDLNL